MRKKQLILYKGHHIYIRCLEEAVFPCRPAFAIARDHGNGTIGDIHHVQCESTCLTLEAAYSAAKSAAMKYVDSLVAQARPGQG